MSAWRNYPSAGREAKGKIAGLPANAASCHPLIRAPARGTGMSISDYFSADYAGGRRLFHEAARAASAALETYHNPASGPDGLALSTETAWLGPRDCERLLVVMSGTHGVEGFCGSGLQVGLLRSGLAKELADGVGLLLIHAINPSGFAWLRRVNEGNVDLNRNFVDHAKPYPANTGYEALRDAICPADWLRGRADAESRLLAYAKEHGAVALQAAITSGQYVDAQGVFYGGRHRSWSNRALAEILKRNADAARHVAFIDLHSGLGPYGVGEIMNNHAPGHPGFERIKDWFGGEATSSEDGSSSSSPVVGDTSIGVDEALPRAKVAGITLEYGTEPLRDMLDAVRADNWLHVHGRLDSAEGRAIKGRIRKAFYPDADDWRAMVWERAVDVSRRMVRGLSQSP
jgi:hypothetical protein